MNAGSGLTAALPLAAELPSDEQAPAVLSVNSKATYRMRCRMDAYSERGLARLPEIGGGLALDPEIRPALAQGARRDAESATNGLVEELQVLNTDVAGHLFDRQIRVQK